MHFLCTYFILYSYIIIPTNDYDKQKSNELWEIVVTVVVIVTVITALEIEIVLDLNLIMHGHYYSSFKIS